MNDFCFSKRFGCYPILWTLEKPWESLSDRWPLWHERCRRRSVLASRDASRGGSKGDRCQRCLSYKIRVPTIFATKWQPLDFTRHVVMKFFQISTFLKVAHSYAFIMKTLMISGLSFALCQSKRSTNMAGRKEPSRICEVYKDLLSSNADSMDGS